MQGRRRLVVLDLDQPRRLLAAVEGDAPVARAERRAPDPDDLPARRQQVELLEQKGLAHYYEFVPRGEQYYKMMAVCDFIVLPSIDETQSGTLARIIALNKPFITIAPMEGLTIPFSICSTKGAGIIPFCEISSKDNFFPFLN